MTVNSHRRIKVAMKKSALRISDVVEESCVCKTLVYAAIKRGELRARKLGRATIILRSDFEEWLRNLPAYLSSTSQ